MIHTTPVRAWASGIVPQPLDWTPGSRLLAARWGHAQCDVHEAPTSGDWYIERGACLRIAASFSRGSIVLITWESPEVCHG